MIDISDVTPKIKMFLFISIISLLINLCAFTLKNSLDIVQFALSFGTSFLPFVDLVNLAFISLPSEAMIFIGVITGILGTLKLVLLTVMLLNSVPFINN